MPTIPLLSVPLRALASACSIAAALSLPMPASAQIPAQSGASPQDNRTAPMGTKADSPPPHALESNTPQAAEAKPQSRGSTKASPGHKPGGAGGFENGLYGTGTGSNK